MKTVKTKSKKMEFENPYKDFEVLNGAMNALERKACKELYMQTENKYPEGFEWGCWSKGKVLCKYNGKPTIICEHIQREDKCIYINLLQFDDKKMCMNLYFTMTR